MIENFMAIGTYAMGVWVAFIFIGLCVTALRN